MATAENCQEIKEKLDKDTNLHSVDPQILAEADQYFFIYSPITANYLFMSKDPALSHKMHTKLEAHGTKLFERNLFKLTRMEDGSYHLHNMETEKHVYVSGEDVLGMEGNPTEAKGHFHFEKYGDTGCYMIKNNEKYLYVSKSKAGIPLCPVVHAAEKIDDCSHVFQFVVPKKVRNAKIKFDIKNYQISSNEKESLVYEFENPSDVEKKEEVVVDTPEKTKAQFKFENGYEYWGDYVGGAPVQCLGDNGVEVQVFGAESCGSVENGGESDSGKSSSTTSITVAPGQKAIVTVSTVEKQVSVPFTIEVETALKRILKGSGTWTGCHTFNSSTHVETKSLDGSEE